MLLWQWWDMALFDAIETENIKWNWHINHHSVLGRKRGSYMLDWIVCSIVEGTLNMVAWLRLFSLCYIFSLLNVYSQNFAWRKSVRLMFTWNPYWEAVIFCLSCVTEAVKSGRLSWVVCYRNWPRYGLRWSGWYCYPAHIIYTWWYAVEWMILRKYVQVIPWN